MITCIGDLVEDVIVYAPDGVRVGTDSAARIERHRGGSAANVAVAAAVIGGSSRYVGNVGADLLGDHLLAQLAAAGVEVAVNRSGRSGSIVAVIGADGERSFLTDRGSSGDLTSAPAQWMTDAQVIHVPMYSLLGDPLRSTTLAMLADAQAAGIPISLDGSSAGAITDAGTADARQLIKDLSPAYLFCNRDEADLLALDEGDPLAAITIIKHGAEPTTVLSNAGSAIFPVPPVEHVVDTTGAGDAFAAGFLVATFQRGESEHAAVAAAHRIAARTVITHGATPRDVG